MTLSGIMCFQGKIGKNQYGQTKNWKSTPIYVGRCIIDSYFNYYESRCFSTLQDDINQDLVNLQNWLHGNKLSLNVVKTQSLIIGSRPSIQKIEKQTEAKPSFEIGDQKINMITDTKYLGVQIDDKLQWDRHIEHVKAKALRACQEISAIR